jgi:hypothetical protein
MNKKEKIEVIKRLTGNKKWLWCPACEKYPDRITETVEVFEKRIWSEKIEDYEFTDMDYGDAISTTCSVCGTELIDKQIEV